MLMSLPFESPILEAKPPSGSLRAVIPTMLSYMSQHSGKLHTSLDTSPGTNLGTNLDTSLLEVAEDMYLYLAA